MKNLKLLVYVFFYKENVFEFVIILEININLNLLQIQEFDENVFYF